MVCKLVGSSFYLFENSFHGIPISMCFMVESEAVAVERSLEPRYAVDEKQRVVDVVFCTEFAEKSFGERDCTRRMEPDVQKFVGFGMTAANSQ